MSKKTEKYYQWKKLYYEKRRENTNNGRKKWLEQDITLLFEFKGTDSELSKVLNRSVQSIQVKRSKIIKAEDSNKDIKKSEYINTSCTPRNLFDIDITIPPVVAYRMATETEDNTADVLTTDDGEIDWVQTEVINENVDITEAIEDNNE